MSSAPAYERILGVVEALTAVRDQCPHAGIRSHAETALGEIANSGAEAIPQQAFLVMSTIGGWRGARSDQVKRSLRKYLDDHAKSLKT